MIPVSQQYPMDNKKGLKIPVQLRVNMWLGLATEEKKFNHYAEGIFNVFAELVNSFFMPLGLERSSLELGAKFETIVSHSMRTRLRF